MPGTLEGGKKAGATNKKLYGEDFYARIGRLGGQKSTNGGFATDRELASKAGRKGGQHGKVGYRYTGMVNGKPTWVKK